MIIHNPILTGSFTVNGTDVSSITSSAANLTALNAITASILSTTGSLNTASGSAITRLSSIETVTGSNITRLSSLEAKTGSYATTGSNTFVDTQTISGSILQSGSFTSTGTLTAQTLVVQTITSSVDFVTGSTRFGSIADNTHIFTGSVYITGSTTLTIASTGATTFNGSDASGWFGGFSNSGTNFAYMGATAQFANSGGTTTDFGIRSANALAFYTGGGNERMRITSGGNLQVTGSATFSGTVIATGFEVGNGQFYRARRTSSNLLTDMIGIPSGTNDVRIVTTGAFNIVNGSTATMFGITDAGAASFLNSVSINSASGLSGAQGFLFFNNSGTNASSRNWKISNDQIDWGDFIIQYSSTQTGATSNTALAITSGGNITVPNLLTPNRLSLSAYTSLYGKKVVKADAVSSFAFNLSTMFPEMSSTFSSNVVGCFGVYTIFRGGAAETGTFSISRNGGGSWSAAAYSVQTATGAYSLSNVTGSGTTITMTFNTSVYVIVEVTAMIE
jgi:hypothetical protein